MRAHLKSSGGERSLATKTGNIKYFSRTLGNGPPLLWLHLLSKPGVLFGHGGNIAQMTKQMPPENFYGRLSQDGHGVGNLDPTPTACAAEQPGEARGKAREQPRLLTYHTPTSYCLVGNDGVETCTNFYQIPRISSVEVSRAAPSSPAPSRWALPSPRSASTLWLHRSVSTVVPS